MSKATVMSFNIQALRFIAVGTSTLVAICSIVSVSAADRLTPQDSHLLSSEGAVRGLSPGQINAIRSVGRNILTAKRHSLDDGADKEQLGIFKEGINRLIQAENSLIVQSAITPKIQENTDQLKARRQNQASTLNNIKSLSQRLRAHAALKTFAADRLEMNYTHSAGMPIGKQRADMFEKWADGLDAALSDEGGGRLTKLQALELQLQSSDLNRLIIPINHGTPTLQAMPSDYVPSISTTGYSIQEKNNKE